MPTFSYRALDSQGKLQQGTIDVAHSQEAQQRLQSKSLRILNIEESHGTTKSIRLKPTQVGKTQSKQTQAKSSLLNLTAKEILIFSEELADLLKGGLQINLALSTMAKRSANAKLQVISSQLLQLVEDGVSLSKACQKASSSFDSLYINLIFAGENSGALDSILDRHVEYMKSMTDLKNKIKIASIYPLILIIMVVAISILFSLVLAPMLIDLISNMPSASKQLPAGIEMMLAIEHFIKHWWWLLLTLIIGSVTGFKLWKKPTQNQLKWDSYIWNMPHIGPIIQSNFFVYFLTTIHNLIANGLPLLKALELGSNTTVNLYARQQLQAIQEDVAQGRSFSSALKHSDFFPPTLIDMISIGEQIGKLNQSIERSAQRYEKELNQKLSKLMAIIPPVIMVIMTIVIGGFLYVMFNAIFSSIGQLGG